MNNDGPKNKIQMFQDDAGYRVVGIF